jgi:hypothetical protein
MTSKRIEGGGELSAVRRPAGCKSRADHATRLRTPMGKCSLAGFFWLVRWVWNIKRSPAMPVSLGAQVADRMSSAAHK